MSAMQGHRRTVEHQAPQVIAVHVLAVKFDGLRREKGRAIEIEIEMDGWIDGWMDGWSESERDMLTNSEEGIEVKHKQCDAGFATETIRPEY